MDKYKVLVYDSGIGGLNVLITLRRMLPYVDFFYLSDIRNAPYGSKTKEELSALSKRLLQSSELDRFSAVVLACNTLSTNCYEELSKAFPKTPFIKVEPPFVQAKQKSLLLCTDCTSKSETVAKYKTKLGESLTVKPLQKLVCDVEKNIYTLYKINLDDYLLEMPKDIDSLFLGCTHYCFLKKQIGRYFPKARLYDGINEAVKQLCKNLTLSNHFNAFLAQRGGVYPIGEDAERNKKIIKYLIKNRII